MPKEPYKSRKAGTGPAPVGRPDGAVPADPVVLGDFELRKEIGRGGMGTVYEAWQLSLQRVVALKVLGQHISASPTVIQRFQREAHAAAKLHHTHIVPIFAQGEVNGVHYYAMELVRGPNLHEIIVESSGKPESGAAASGTDETLPLDRADLDAAKSAECAKTEQELAAASSTVRSGVAAVSPPAEFRTPEHFATVARHIASLADALEYAHQEGVVHRDVKPHNLILGSDGRMRIADFGLARVAAEPGVTVTGELIGSPLYMSPEQITEGPGQTDRRTDIYSLGATMYEWLTGIPPYPGETRERVISRILSSEPAPLRVHNPDIPVDLETICLKAIERDRYRRYQTAEGLSDDLRRFLRNRPIKARRIGISTRLRRAVVRHPVATIGAVAGSLVIGLVSALYFAHLQVESQKRMAESQAEAVAEAQQKAEDLLGLVRPLLPSALEPSLSLVEAARPLFEGVFDSGQSGATSSGGGASVGANSASAARPEEIARRAARDLYEAIAPRYWPSSPLAHECSYAVLGGIKVHESDAAKARRIVDQCLLSHPDQIEARQLHLALCGQMRQYDTMATDARQLILQRRSEPAGHLWLGLARLLLDEAQQGLAEFDRAAELAGRRNVRFVWAKALRGLALICLERPDDALVELNETLVLAPDLAVALLARASAGAALGDRASAVADLTRVIEREPENADTIALRGEHHASLGRFDEAIRDFNEAMRIAGPTPTLRMQVFAALMAQQNKARPAESPTATGPPRPPEEDRPSSIRAPRRNYPMERSVPPLSTRQTRKTARVFTKLFFATLLLR